MLKYTVAMLAVLAALGTVAFLILARLNEDGAEADRVPELTIVVDAGGVSPLAFDAQRGKLTIVTLENRAGFSATISLQSDDVEQSPFDTRPDVPLRPAPNVRLIAAAGQTAKALVRFKARGDYELVAETPIRTEALGSIAVQVQ